MTSAPDIEAIVTFIPTDQGGRRSAVRSSGYRPDNLVLPLGLVFGQHEYPDCEEVVPGESARALITFGYPEVFPHSMWAGKIIRVQEGSRVVGHAQVTKVLNRSLLGRKPSPIEESFREGLAGAVEAIRPQVGRLLPSGELTYDDDGKPKVDPVLDSFVERTGSADLTVAYAALFAPEIWMIDGVPVAGFSPEQEEDFFPLDAVHVDLLQSGAPKKEEAATVYGAIGKALVFFWSRRLEEQGLPGSFVYDDSDGYDVVYVPDRGAGASTETIAIAGNVLVPAILALEALGFEVRREEGDDSDGQESEEEWIAESPGLTLIAEDPAQLLGLATMRSSRGSRWKASDEEIDEALRTHRLDS